jgi:serine phosphatase RsbU (regulator of sigma subunit)/anti-sigma regulatory factor (Ser/Thr protein kinase)
MGNGDAREDDAVATPLDEAFERLARIAEREQQRSALLLSLSEAFSGASTTVQVERALQSVVRRHLKAVAYLGQVDPSGRRVRFTSTVPDIAVATAHAARSARQATTLWHAQPLLGDAVTGRKNLFFADACELVTRYPYLDGNLDNDGACSVVPVYTDDKVSAILCIRWDHPRLHDDDAASLEDTLSQYMTHALDRIALLDARRQVATTLQSALLSPPPTVAHLDIATTYEPAVQADQVGGDWYDVVSIDEDTTLLMIGDVAGHDMQAAAHMGQLRSMLRALAWSHDETPAVLLSLLDRANHQLGPRADATVIVTRVQRLRDADPGMFSVTWSNAGHPPPLILRESGLPEVLSPQPDIMIGVRPDTQRVDHATVLRPGETLLLYTDGLVESRGTELAERITLLAETFGRLSTIGTAELPAALVRALVPAPQRDDIAVLAMRAREIADAAHNATITGHVWAQRQVADSLADIGPARRWIDDILETSGIGRAERRVTMLLSSEVLTNALEHGTGPITVTVEIADRVVRVSVQDGSPQLPRLRYPEPQEFSGRGVQFLDRLSTRWGVSELARDDGKTVWFEIAC